MTRYQIRSAALMDLLLTVEAPADTIGKYSYRLPRDPKRNPDVIKRDLATAYVAWRNQIHGKDISEIISVRRKPTFYLRVLKRA